MFRVVLSCALVSLISAVKVQRLVGGDELGCALGFSKLDDTRCISDCPEGFEAVGMQCSGKGVTIRRRLAFTGWINKNIIKPVGNGFRDTGRAIHHGANQVGNAIRTMGDAVAGAVGGFMDIVNALQRIAKKAVTELSGASGAKWVMENKYYEHYRWGDWYKRYALTSIMNGAKNVWNYAKQIFNGQANFGRMKQMLMTLYNAAKGFGGVLGGMGNIGFGRRMEELHGVNVARDEMTLSWNDVQRIAETMLKEQKSSDEWDQRRRQEFIEENRAMIVGMLRDTDTVDAEGPQRRIDAAHFTTILSLSMDVFAMGIGQTMEIAVGFNDDWNNASRGIWTACKGFQADIMGGGVSMGIAYMDARDIEGASTLISFGADFPGAEVGCAINLVKIGSKVVGGGWSCGAGVGVNPISIAVQDCNTNFM